MAFCANCGASLPMQAGFCGNCGKPTVPPGQESVAAPQVSGLGTPAAAPVNPGISANLAGALTYSLGFITGIIFLVVEPYKNDRFVRFHAMQSILFSVACVVFSVAWGIVVGILINISGFLALAALSIRLFIALGIFLFWLYLMYQAYSQREYRIPFIGQIAAKQVG